MWRGLPALALAALPLLAAAPASHAGHRPPAAPASAAVAGVSGVPGVRAPLPLFEAVDRIPVAEEQREGYTRSLYKHWNRGLNTSDGCDTRREVILSEAVEAPQVAAGCKMSGGSWLSPYDDVVVTDSAGLDVDHFVPLAEVHDSGGFAWDAARREAYANDQASPLTLIAVTAKSNRSKADKDPAQWLPPAGGYHCEYAAQWTATKLRWDLAADDAERQALLGVAEDCPDTTVVYEPAA
ncbi:HNH endonuclease family protein [Streptomyces sp. NBC_00162]|uniref:HNH endonuclease family protein n=1 Tax=Streptomyces sp. NBC_00162 TaxID=2903629 RepID=UPI00214B626B|nr:HNH endonuclease family protein [Streptomyces sp. NBC_00162]UUU44396.1 HNH endonuclease family protein [Streptomyces sp. NBC_00162]